MKSRQSNFNSRSPVCYLARSYLIATVICSPSLGTVHVFRQHIAMFADVQYSIFADVQCSIYAEIVGGWAQKVPKCADVIKVKRLG